MKKQAYAFLEKLNENDALPGLHIEPIKNSADPRVRTGRVSDFYRAVLFKLQGKDDEAHYIYLGVRAHDDAIAYAKQVKLSVNPVNGIAELIEGQMPPEPEPAAFPARVLVPLPVPQVVSEPETAEVKEPAEPWLVRLGITQTDLTDELGIDLHLAELAMEVTSEDDLMDVAEEAVAWQGEALLELAAGATVAEVRDSLGFEEKVESAAETEDDELLIALRHPAAQMQFAFIEDNDELRRVIEDEDFAAWRVFLHPEQRKYVEHDYSGPFRLSGGAGTGKTVVLLHRARALAKKDPSARILLTTFTTTLAEALRTDMKSLDPSVPISSKIGQPGVFVSGVDAAASAVMKAASGVDLAMAVETVLGARSSEMSKRTNAGLVWQEVIDSAGTELPENLRSPAFFAAEYVMVVLPNRITTREAYFKVRRPGRGVALDRGKRAAVWAVIEAYRSWTNIDGSIDFTEAAAIAAARLELATAAGEPHMFDHVLVDEGQDLSPSQWQLLRGLVGEHENDLFIAEDSHQRIYGQRVVLGRLGIRIVGRSQRLTLNYRTTAQNLRYAVSVLQGTVFVDLEDEPENVDRYRSARTGPTPRLVATESLGEQLDKAAEVVDEWLEVVSAPEDIGILVRDSQQASQVSRGLEERGVAARLVTPKSAPKGLPLIMTMHRAKGMEFSRVLIFGASEGTVPATYLLKNLTDADLADALQRERSLLYVSATRARDELVIMWSGEPSEMLPSGSG